MPAPHERRYYTATPDGKTYGPYPAAQLPQLLASGNISYNTPVCGEGDQQWTTLAAIAPYIGIAAPPPPPGAGAGGPPAMPAMSQQPVRTGGDSTKGLRLGTLIAALALFFLPWLEFRCSGQGIVQQSGFDAAMGNASLASGMKDMARLSGEDPEKEMKKGKGNGEAGHAWLVAGAAAAIVLALGAGLSGSASGSGLLALLAAGLIGAQMVMGFPLEKDFKEKMGESGLQGGASPFDSLPKTTAPPGGTATPLDPSSRELEKQMQMMGKQIKLEVAFLPSLWAELGLLILCGILGLKAPRR